MKVLINGELCFTGNDKQVQTYIQKIADARRKTAIGKQILKAQNNRYWGYDPSKKVREAEEINYPLFKITFVK